MSEAGNMNLGWEAVKGLIAKSLMAATGFIGILIFTRIVGKSDFGGYYLLLSVVFILDRPIRGFCQAVRKRWSESGSAKREILGAVLLVNLIGFVLISAGVLILDSYIVSYTGLNGAAPLFLTIFGSLILWFPFQQIMGAMGYPSKQVWNDALRSLFTLPLQIGLVLCGLGALGMGYGLAGATLLSVPFGVYVVSTRPSLPSRKTISSLWEYAKYSSPNAIVGETYSRIDIILLGLLAGTTSVANYEVAFKMVTPATFASGVVGSALMPKISNLISEGKEFKEDVNNSISYVSILGIPIFFGALAIPESLVVTAFGPQYSDAGPYLIGLALYQVISTQTAIYFQTLSGMDLPKIGLKVNSLTLAFNIAIGAILVFSIGAIGIVVGTVLAEALRYLLTTRSVVRRIDDITPIPRTLIMQILAGISMYLIVHILNTQIMVSSWVDLGILVGAGALVYGSVLIVISPDVRSTTVSVYRDSRA
ncbi:MULTISPECIES: lipopolysaccharide biosynthesis protein [Halobacterium]|uniref:lipopolysaccharide biosynthesis protein n=1 Tax=Halobacterium TaxID=2239 RepID=UPI0009EC96B7|nr:MULTISPECIES: oligosaccharide flippase family protein [Halobacterium]MCG1003036.1 oligosaccharide flippase family protein [Halobacterium noricense]